MFEITKSTSANIQSPRAMKNIAAVATAPMARNNARNRFLTGARSAIAPSSGATMATTRIAQVVAHANRLVATGPGTSAAATFWKKIGKIAAMIVVWNAE